MDALALPQEVEVVQAVQILLRHSIIYMEEIDMEVILDGLEEEMMQSFITKKDFLLELVVQVVL